MEYSLRNILHRRLSDFGSLWVRVFKPILFIIVTVTSRMGQIIWVGDGQGTKSVDVNYSNSSIRLQLEVDIIDGLTYHRLDLISGNAGLVLTRAATAKEILQFQAAIIAAATVAVLRYNILLLFG